MMIDLDRAKAKDGIHLYEYMVLAIHDRLILYGAVARSRERS